MVSHNPLEPRLKMQPLQEAKCIHHWGNRSQGSETAKPEGLCHRRGDQGMSSRKGLDRAQSWGPRAAILILYQDVEMDTEEIGRSRGDEHEVAIGNVRDGHLLNEDCVLTNSRWMP